MRKILKVAAKLAVESEINIGNYESLTDTLRKEFSIPVSSVDIHKKLTATVKQKNETLLEYIIKKKKIGSKDNIDEKSIVTYIIQGIPDKSLNKVMLYDAQTIS